MNNDHVVVTIARQYGSGGRTVGEMLAKKLGWSFYDKQIIHMASDESGIDVSLFGKVEGGDSVKPSLFAKNTVYKGELIHPDSKGFISDENIFNYQAKVVNDLAEKESYVIVGRCVNYVFKDDKRKQEYYHRFAGGVWNDATNYDLCLNSGKLGFEKCVEAIEAQMKIMLGK